MFIICAPLKKLDSGSVSGRGMTIFRRNDAGSFVQGFHNVGRQTASMCRNDGAKTVQAMQYTQAKRIAQPAHMDAS